MKLLELYVQAFRAFRQFTKTDEDAQKLRQAIIHSNHKDDIFTTIRYICEIDEEWIENIEEGLVYVEKAIREDRQFIRTEGEVVQIEKVKSVSKASIEHLSKHSNFITRIPKDNPADIIPDKLYISEKLSDYLVYENRFLYLLLTYVKNFIEIRLDKIKEKTSMYQSSIQMDKDIEETTRNIKFKLEYEDSYMNDQFLIDQFKEIPLVKRADTVYAIAITLLNTPLMRTVAKAPMIKPPVIKTNVLRMNPNFKAALSLYDYISSYSKEGFELVESKKSFNPFSSSMVEELAETIELTSIIGYLEGLDIRESIDKKIDAIEESLLKQKNKERKDNIKRLKKRIVEMDEDPTEYIYLLEKRNQELEKLDVQIEEEIEKNKEFSIIIADLKNVESDLNSRVERLRTRLQLKENEIDELKQKYFEDMTEAEILHQKEEEILKDINQNVIIEIKKKHEQNKQDLIEQKNIEKTAVEQEYMAMLAESKKETKAMQEENTSLENTIANLNDQIATLKQEKQELDEQKHYANAQYTALKAQQGLLSEEEDFSSKERFKQLELERKAYKKLFRQEWKKAKQKIKEQAKNESFEKVKKK